MIAPPLERLADFVRVMGEHDLQVRREFVHASVGPCAQCNGTGLQPGTDAQLCDRCGGGATEAYGGYWTVLIYREVFLPDGRLWARVVDVGEPTVTIGIEDLWHHQAQNFDAMWARDMQEV